MNEKGELLEGINITVSNTLNITATNKLGEFLLRRVDKNALLLFTGATIESYKISVADLTALPIVVRTKVSAMEEVTVSTGYQKIPKDRATGSFVTIDNELFNRKVDPNILSHLNGISSGVLFDDRKETPNIQIRGLYTLTEASRSR